MLEQAWRREPLKATLEAVERRFIFPLGRNCLDLLPKPVNVQELNGILDSLQICRGDLAVDARIKIARCVELFSQICFGAGEEVAVIDKMGLQPAVSVFGKDGLPIISVLCAHVNQPGEPEGVLVANAPKPGMGKDFKEAIAALAEIAGAEAKARVRPECAAGGLHPAGRVTGKESVGDMQRFPLRNRQAAGAIKLAASAFIEEEIWSLKVIGEFDHIGMAVACLSQDWLGTTVQIANVLRQENKVLL